MIFDEGEDNNKGLLEQALQMMNPFTSFRTAFDDFTPGKKKNVNSERETIGAVRFLSRTAGLRNDL